MASGRWPSATTSGSVKKFPLLLDITASSIIRCLTWNQWRTNGFPVAPSLCAISFS